ncbi:MAG: spermidine synthase, partial [Pontimonas sp.]|nr:spermidine synthase [Pontimonas sp.]
IQEMARHLKPGGVFALWSDDPPDDDFLTVLATVFSHVSSEVVSFDNPLIGKPSTNTIYLAR